MLFLFFALSFILYGCPFPQNEVEKKIEDNKMNLPSLKPHNQLGISYELSELFTTSNFQTITIKSSSNSSVNYATADNSILFTIERFSPSEITTLQFSSDTDNQSDIDVLHNHYCKAILNSNYNTVSSEVENLFPKTGKKGLLQHIESSSDDSYKLHFSLASIHFKGNYYVFQFIAGKQIMPYLYDDFLNIIKSVR